MSDIFPNKPGDDSQLTPFEDRPFFEQALRFGVRQGIISQEKINAIATEAPKGMVQIATTFGSPYLRAEIELARLRIVNLVSLYLSEASGADVETAARLICDNTFLTLSRGGSTLLKELFALPEYSVLGSIDQGRVEDFLEFWSRKKSNTDYQQTRKQRKQYQLEIKLAKKLATTLHLPNSIFQAQHSEADSLIRSTLLLRMQKGLTPDKAKNLRCFDHIEFASLLNTMRKKGVNTKPQIEIELTPNEQHIIAVLLEDIIFHDIPKIADAKLPLDGLINHLENRYFIREHEIEDTASYDALVSKEWSKQTKGKNDIDAILTLLLCIAAKMPNKVSLSEATAKTLIKKIRKEGFFPELASQFIKQHAPHEKQESLLEDWSDFSEQAQLYLLDDDDRDFYEALHFLHDNCYVDKVVKVEKKSTTKSR